MPKFGICTSLSRSAEVKQAGWDFVEENVQSLFKGNDSNDKYDGKQRIALSALPVAAANCLVPGHMKITGPAVDMASLERYMINVLQRAGEAGCRRLVFGSGGARQVPAGWGKSQAIEQIITFGRMAAPIAAQHGVTVTLEHLCAAECNIVTTLTEELAIVQRVNHPNFQALLDTYHFWADGLAMADIDPLLPYIKHVHLADKAGRVAPGESRSSDYRPVFSRLKSIGYDGGLSVEAMNFGDIPGTGPRVLAFLKQQWQDA